MGLRILVIEDEDEIADFVVRGLREEGFAVERAADGDGRLAPPGRRPVGRRPPRLVAAGRRTGSACSGGSAGPGGPTRSSS